MSTAESLPEHIGPFRPLRVLGDGAQGRVYLAQQEEPRREVALKVLRTASASAEFTQRFQREVDVLARLDHPGIARVYAAGSADSAGGRVPWLALEYIAGTDLAQHAARLRLQERIGLLVEICAAVHHAHTRGVVHRDLKPANILVDAGGRPRILDFGVAHLISEDGTQMTVAGQILGTVAYLAPELLGGGAAADPHSDVYALGVIAYELFSGQLPYPGLSHSTIIEALEILRRGTPQRLSQVLPTARGDLDTIVMKALAPEPARRYGSAAELAADLSRFLDNRPIEARPPSVGYVLGLFVRRHRALSTAAALAVLLLVAGVGFSSYFALRASAALEQAQLRLAERETVNRFLGDMLTAADPTQALGKKLTVLDMADAAYQNLKASQDRPAVLATLQRTLGQTYLQLGEQARAQELFEQALTQARSAVPADAALIARLRLDRIAALTRQGTEQAAVAAGELPALLDDLRALEASQPALQELRLEAMIELARTHEIGGRLPQAEDVGRATYAETRERLGPLHRLTLMSGQMLSSYLRLNLKTTEALSFSEELARANEQAYGFEHPLTLQSHALWAVALDTAGRDSDSIPVYRRVLDAREKVLGENHPNTLESRYNLAQTLIDTGDLAAGLPMAEVVVRSFIEQFGADDQRSLFAAGLLATAQDKGGRPQEAIATLQRAKADYNRKYPTMHPGLAKMHLALANLLARHATPAAADAEFRWLEMKLAQDLGPTHLSLAMVKSDHALLLLRQKKYAETRDLLEPVMAQMRTAFSDSGPRTLKTAQRLRQALLGLGDKAAAAKLQAELKLPEAE